MLNLERQLGTIVDLLLPLDKATRYDVYFTDKRIAIICMGHSNRFDSGVSQSRSYLFGIAPEALTSVDDQRKNRQIMEEKIKELSFDEKIKLSKKSCFYTYDEIEKVKLISEKKLKFTILSKECITKFSPNEEQFKQLTALLPNIEMLKKKLSIFGKLDLNAVHKVNSTISPCRYCSYENDLDAIYCQSCGNQIQTETPRTLTIDEISCSCCGVKNKVQALFCKKCGAPIDKNQKSVLKQS
jgi:Double zinc ribbon